MPPEFQILDANQQTTVDSTTIAPSRVIWMAESSWPVPGAT